MNQLRVPYKVAVALSLLATIGFVAACNSSDDTTVTPTTTTGSVSTSDVIKAKYTNAVGIATSGTNLVLSSQGVPDHVTPYWGVGNALYEAQKTGGTVNPGIVRAQTFVMTIPATPGSASSKEATALGPIGMALNGVAIYNDQEGGNQALDTGVIGSFDRGGAHVGPGGVYHYHVSGDFTSKDDANLIGFLRDGFPIYGRKDKDGTYPANLDAYGGHTAATTEFTTPIYHYHCSNVNYLNTGVYVLKAGSYYGTKGTFTQ